MADEPDPKAFDALMGKLVQVPKKELDKAERRYRKRKEKRKSKRKKKP